MLSSRSVSEIIRELLTARGVISVAEQAQFLDPDFDRDTHSPWLLPNIEVAIDRLQLAHELNERVLIFGDYDADGVPATALLLRTLGKAGLRVEGMIPKRHDGYGLTPAAVAAISDYRPDLLVTVDNGTVSRAEIAELAGQGIPTIVIDHHEALAGHTADAAIAIVNPKQPKSTYPWRELCAAALAWKVAWAFYDRLGLPTAPLKWELDLVALSTIADMVPLMGENRVLAQYGLRVMKQSRNHGLIALAMSGGVDLTLVRSGDVGFRLAPRINAPSRMHAEMLDGANAALSLLTAESSANASRLAAYLSEQNQARQTLLDTSIAEALAQAETLQDHPVLVVYQPHWSSGVIGLMASRLMDQFKRPAIVMAQESGVLKGSARSVDGIEAPALFTAAAARMERFGGHAKAGGFTLVSGDPDEHLHELRSIFGSYVMSQGVTIADMAARSHKPADLTLRLDECSLALAHGLEELEPFGIGFPAPLISVIASVKGTRIVGKTETHRSWQLQDGATLRSAIGFSMAATELAPGVPYRWFLRLSADTWQGQEQLKLQVDRVEPISPE